jgi:hypothetical protein
MSVEPHEERPGFEFWECYRCSGKGHVRGFENVAGGLCFACGGTGGRWVSESVAKRRRASAARQETKRAADQAVRCQELDDSRRADGWTLDDFRDVVLDEASAEYGYATLWDGHEDHPRYPAEPIPREWRVWPE